MLKKLCRFFCLTILALCFFVTPAEASIIYFKPIGGTMDPSSVFPVEIRLHAIAPESVAWTSVYFTYPDDKLEVSYVRPAKSFPVNIGNTYGQGTFAMTRQNIDGITGDVLIATVGFKPKKVNTTASLQFVDGVTALQKDNSETLDLEWTKANIAQYNISDGKITYNAGVVQGGPMSELPKAGLFDNTGLLLGFGSGLIFFGGLGIVGAKKFRTQKNTIS